MSCQFSLLGLAVNPILSFFTTLVSVNWFCWVSVRGPKFGSMKIRARPKETVDICIHITDSLCCTPETNTISITQYHNQVYSNKCFFNIRDLIKIRTRILMEMEMLAKFKQVIYKEKMCLACDGKDRS